MPVRGPGVLEGIRIARNVVADPAGVFILWKTTTGGSIAGCLRGNPVPEIPFAADLLPVPLESMDDVTSMSEQIDAWLIGSEAVRFRLSDSNTRRFALPSGKPANMEDSLDRLESLAEWACNVSGRPVSEGRLWRSIRSYAFRRSLLHALDDKCARQPAFLTLKERRDIVRAGNFLPPDAHSRILSSLLENDSEPSFLTEGEMGDPLLILAKRLLQV